MNERDLAEFAVRYGSDLGASYVEARCIREEVEGYSTRNGEVLSAGKRERRGMGIRMLVGGTLAFCSVDDLKSHAVKASVSSTFSMARAIRRRHPIRFSEEDVHEDSWAAKVVKPFDDVDREEKLRFLSDLDRSVASIPGNISLRRFSLKLSRGEKYLVTSEGTRLVSESSLFSLTVMIQAEEGGNSEQRYFGVGGSGGWEWAENMGVEERVVTDAENTLKVVSKAKPIDLGKTDVIIGAEVAGIVAHENCGHPSEADRILGREAAQAGESWYVDLQVGESRIGSEALTVVDDPTIEGSAGYYLYDDEGVKARPRYLIKDGVLNELLLNREFAHRFGTHSTAAARANGYDREPIIRMANTYIAPGDHSMEELIEGVKHGIFMRNFTEWNIDDRRFQSKYVGSEAVLIDSGKLTETYVRRPVLELTTQGLFSSVDACSRGFEADLATCGKSDPMQGIPVWTAGPAAVRLRGVRVGVGI